MNASSPAEDAALVHDPATYVEGVPYAALSRLRDGPGIAWVQEPELPGWPAGQGYWLVLRHDDIRAVVGDAATFSSAEGGTQIRDPATPEDLAYVRRMMLNMDAPEHARLRRMLGRSFTPRAVAALEAGIAQTADALVTRMLAGPTVVDVAKDVAADLPLITLADVLGVPREDRFLMFDWSNRVIGWQDLDYAVSAAFDPATGSDLARAALEHRPNPGADGRMPDPRSRGGMPDLYTYAHLLGRAKRADPGDDVMSTLMGQRDDLADGQGSDGHVSIEEFENLFWLFAVAGNETLRNGIPGGLVALLEHPTAQRELRDDPSLIPGAVEEMLRWWTPVMTFRRTATRTTSIAGQQLSAGDKVVVSFSAGNRDPRAYAAPDAFDIHRTGPAHLSFGHGPHFCLGAHLARVQMRELFTQLLTRTSWLEPAGPPAYLRSNFQRGVKQLPIRWTA